MTDAIDFGPSAKNKTAAINFLKFNNICLMNAIGYETLFHVYLHA